MKKEQTPGFKTILFYFFLLIVFWTFSGCATMKKEECLTVDWYSVGFEDGTKGYKVSRIGSHRKSCAKYGVMPDLQLYQEGRSEGLFEYCTPNKGFRLGLRGRPYNDVCRGELKGPFQEAYNIGKDIYFFEHDILQEQKDLELLNQEMVQLKDLLKNKEDELGKNCTGAKKCKKILGDIRSLDKKKRGLRFKIISKKKLIAHMKQTLADMKLQPMR